MQDMASRAEPSFLEGMASRAELFTQKLEPKPSRAEPSFGSDPTLLGSTFIKGVRVLTHRLWGVHKTLHRDDVRVYTGRLGNGTPKIQLLKTKHSNIVRLKVV